MIRVKQKICFLTLTLFAHIVFFNGCASNTENSNKWESQNKIMLSVKEVIEKHSDAIMKIEGVVGIYEGMLDDNSPVITIMVIKKSEALLKKLPTSMEGYPVTVDETGEIKPL
ncbi:MAG: hypothetical protein PVH88_00105 [Ignavibacteria bacterium]|jgi:hypothetical protein